MKLTDMNNTDYRKMNRIFESRFGFQLDFDSLTLKKARNISAALTEAISKMRKSPDFYKSEKNPQYTEFMLCRESINKWISEQHRKVLSEGEVGQAEALLAARDIVDSIQGMLEKVGKLQNEQMPALIDAIRDQIGSAQAESFKATISALLTSLGQQITAARDQSDTAVRTLTGEESATAEITGAAQPAEEQPASGDEFAAQPAEEMPSDEEAANAGREVRA
jgi:hypothetical protein